MGKIQTEPFEEVAFRCGCGHNFHATPDVIKDEPERPWHPWAYQAKCPSCSDLASQAYWELSLYKARSKATGPKTEAGIAAVSRNIEGHPTPEEALRTRFNAVKHGARAAAATYFPAKPGKYSACEGCEFFQGCEHEIACQKKTELYLRHHIAFETRDPSMLSGLRATLQANIQAIIDDIVLTIIQDGVRLKTPEWYYDSDGHFHLAAYAGDDGEKNLIYKLEAHPLLKTLGDMVAKNGMTLASEGMTMRQQEGLGETSPEQEGVSAQEMRDFQKKNSEQMESLQRMIGRSAGVIDVTPSESV